MTELSNLKVNEFTALLGSEAPAPGGGSAAALCGSLGASLAAMVANLTLGRAKYGEYQELAAETAEKADSLRLQLLAAMERDSKAYDGFMAALAMPKESEEEKKLRRAAMDQALIESTESPLATMELARQVLSLTQGLMGRSNTNAVSDLAVSALCLRSAVQGAWLNVLINIGSMKDPELAAAYRSRGEGILAESIALAEEIYHRIESSM